MLIAFPFYITLIHSRPCATYFQGSPVSPNTLRPSDPRMPSSVACCRFHNRARVLRTGAAFLCTLFLTFASLNARAADLNTLSGDGVEVLFSPPLEQAAQVTARLTPQIKQALEEIFGWRFNWTPTVILMEDDQLFRQMTHSPLVVGFAVPKKDLVVIHYTGVRTPSQFQNILTHELCHLLIHKHVKSVPIPRWFDEGIAQWVSNGVMDIIHDQKEALLPTAAFSDQLIPLGALKNRFPENANGLRLAYEESKSFIDYLISTYGKSRILEILALMKHDIPVRKAFVEVLGTPLFQIEKQWRKSLKQNIAWFAHLSYYLYEILFAFGALIVIYGFIRLWRKKRAYMEEE
jgi:hypothetical protein